MHAGLNGSGHAGACAPVFLIGYMGCGKTTLGRAVARVAAVDFIDLDLYIENRFRRPVRDIFAERGEDGFRLIERNMLHEVAEFENVIVACGGGTPCFFDNMDYMNSRGTTVLLEASPERLQERLCRGRARRPLIAAMTDGEIAEFTRDALLRRMPFYSKAKYTFMSDELENRSEIAGSVERFIALTRLPLRQSPV